MITLPGYEIIQQIQAGNGFTRFAGRYIADSRPVVFLFFPTNHAMLSESAAIADAYSGLPELRSAHVIPVYTVEKVTDGPETGILLVMGTPDGIELSKYRHEVKLSLIDSLDIAIQLSTAVNDMHQAGFIHKGLTLSGIGIDPDSKTVHIIDFPPPLLMGPPSNLYNDQDMGIAGIPIQNLPYMSPEQTGRMNRRIDFRTDFYSLGIILYQLFTGASPFSNGGPEKVIHEHIAHSPSSPDRIRPEIPAPVSDIIMKLLAKDPENRYQSAYGLRADLKSCHEMLVNYGHIEASFSPGNQDAPEVLMLSDALLGRSKAINRLEIEFQRIQREDIALVLISGEAGMGKTRLLADFEKYVTNAGGYFLKGRCEQLYQNIPYGAIIQAFSGMIRHILTKSPDEVEVWRSRLLEALGANARIIVDVIPEMEYIIGRQDELTALSPADAQSRFNITFENFLRVFAAKDHPLVIFIDNMQWADSATLQQMKAFIVESAARHILLIGAYRQNEISRTHPLQQTIDTISSKNVRLIDIKLDSLAVSDIDQLISASLKRTMRDTTRLANLVHQNTGGNPYFARLFLALLYAEGMLFYDFNSGTWQWDIGKIRARERAYNIGDFIDEKIKNLPENTQAVLKFAACIGDRFDLETLSKVAGKDVVTVAFDLWHATEANVITVLGETDRPLRGLLIRNLSYPATDTADSCLEAGTIYLAFWNEKFRQTVYAMLPEDRKKALHLQIGRLLLETLDSGQLPSYIFQVVNHLNHGSDLVEGRERIHLAELNLMAGRKAVDSQAYTQAQEYFKTGEELLPESAWQKSYSLIFALSRGVMECEYFNQHFDQAEKRFQVLIHRAETDADCAEIYTLKMIMLASLAKHEAALEIGIAGLRLLGVNLPDTAGRLSVLKSMVATKLKLHKYSIDDLLNLPQINDRRLLLVMNLLSNLSFSAFICSPYVAIAACLKAVDLTLKFGNSKASPFGYIIYGASLCAVFRNYETGRKFGDLALTANAKFGTQALTPKLLLFYASGISVWTEHLNKGLEAHRKGVKIAFETGDTNYAVYHIQSVLIFLIASGAPLDIVAEECERYFQFVKKSNDIGAINYLLSVGYYIRCLKGETAAPESSADKEFHEDRHVANMEKDGIQIILLRHFLLKLRLLYVMGDIKGALEVADAGLGLLHYHMGTLIPPEFRLYHAMALAAAYPQMNILERSITIRKIKRLRAKFRILARQCPENFEHKYFLIAAAHEWISGGGTTAAVLYHKASQSAWQNGFIQHHAIANELAAKFYQERQFDEIARICLTMARDAYRKWGAHAKVAALENEFPEIPAGKLPDKGLPAFDHLDFSAIINALQTISMDIVLPDLLKSLMHIMLENAGATKTQFYTLKKDRIYLEAEHTVNAREAIVFESMLAEARTELFSPVLNYVMQTGKPMVLDDAVTQTEIMSHPYIEKYQPRSVLCLPVLRQTQVVALLYLENRIAPSVFTPARIEVLQLLASQAAISLENARLFESVIQQEQALREVTQRREDESLKYQAQLRSLSSQLSLTEERERRRIATELHDRIGHALTNASMKLSHFRNRNFSEDEKSKIVADVHALVEQSIQDTQALTFELSPPILYDLGLEAAIDWLAEQTQLQHGITVNCIDDMTLKPIDESLRVLLFQATRELLFNVVKHAEASQVTISISREEAYVRITIEDNGIGFDAAKFKPRYGKKGGFGLFSIRERLTHQGGRLEVHSEPGKGTCFTMISLMKSME